MSSIGKLRKNAENYRINEIYKNMTPEQYRQGIEYAVKTNGASTLSFNQIKLLAEKISSGNFSKQMLLNMKEEAAKKGEQMKSRHPVFSATKKNIEKIINETTEDNLGLQSAQGAFKLWEKNR